MSNRYYKTVNTFLTILPSYLYNSPDTEPADLLTSLLSSLMTKIVQNFDKVVTEEYSLDQLEK